MPKRGVILTALALLFALAALTDILKPFHLEGPTTGLVFFGRRLAGTPNAIFGPILGIILLIYAAGIWRMRGYAIYLGYLYAIYVSINLFLFVRLNPSPGTANDMIFGLVYTALALILTWGTAFLLSRRRAELA